MEIMIKAKQKDNAQFMFLNYEDELNAYYKHLVDCIKLGKYVPATSVVPSSSTNDSNGEFSTPVTIFDNEYLKSGCVFS